MRSAVEPARRQTTTACFVIAAAGGHRVVLVADEHGLHVTGTHAGGLHGDNLAVLIAVQHAGEPDTDQVAHAVEGLAHAWTRADTRVATGGE